jgi:hypothetical protein
MPLEAQLAPFTKLAASLFIIGSILDIQSANEILQSPNNNQSKKTTPNTQTPLELVTKGNKFYLAGSIIFFMLASARLEQSEMEVKAGTENADVTPDLYVTIGWLFSVIGSSLRLHGHNLELNNSTNPAP